MEIIFIITLAIQALISLAAGLTGVKKGKQAKEGIFTQSARFMYRRFFAAILAKSAGREKIINRIGHLHPGKDRAAIAADFYIEKIRVSYALLLAGNILALAVSLYISQNGLFREGALLPKNTWQGGSYSVGVTATVGGAAEGAEGSGWELSRDITIVVEPVSLEEEAVGVLAREAFALLPEAILAENESLAEVVSSLTLPAALPGYPFDISWDSDDMSLVRNDGRIDNAALTGAGAVVGLTAHLLYQDQWADYSFSEVIHVHLLPPPATERDPWAEAIAAALEASQRENAHADALHLPGEIGGAAVDWQERRSPDGFYLWLAAVAAAITAFIMQDRDVEKKAAARDVQIDRDYPELVRKLALYLGAGMTLRGAWKRTALDNRRQGAKKVKYLYEEMLYSVREMENGIAEREVYERFGRRVGLARYRKLAGLLSNHLQKGNHNLLQVLRGEAEAALEDARKQARTIGEEMSTKLLLPMMMMLVIVMAIIMVPAFGLF